MKEFNVGSLFAGVGGICLGFQNAVNKNTKYNLVWANEIDEYACETYRTNFSHELLEGNIRYILHPDESDDVDRYTKLHERILDKPIDILNGGFPCQAFSIAGKRQGFADERGNLFLSIIDLISQLGQKHYKPRILFLENVKNLKAHDDGNTYRTIKEKLEACDYIIKETVLNTMHYSDLPQNRERIYIIGFLNKSDADKFDMFNSLDKYKVNKTADDRVADIKNILDFAVSDAKYFYTPEKYPNYFDDNYFDDENAVNLKISITELYQFYQIRRGQYVRKNKSNVCPTLTANMGTGGHNVPLILTPEGKIRKLTPVEVFKLQGFSVGQTYKFPALFKNKTYTDSHLYKQAGNAVSVPVITLIANELLKILD